MHRGLGTDIVKGDASIVFVDNLRGNLLLDNLEKDIIRHHGVAFLGLCRRGDKRNILERRTHLNDGDDMAWLIGIDEAGYGPNLGPFVMSAVAWHVSDALLVTDLWAILRDIVRRHDHSDDDRLIVDDSKAVYALGGLGSLERNLLPIAAPWLSSGTPLTDYIEQVCPSSHDGLRGEKWYTGKTALPTVEGTEIRERSQRFDEACQKGGVRRGPVRSVAICTPRFNSLLDQCGSKGGILAEALTELLQAFTTELDGDDALHVFADKHGGRNTYAAMLQNALPMGMLIVREEGALRSHYEILGASRPIHITFQPRADVEHFSVALASMASKYLRELCMIEFNQFWLTQVPGLTPTAGYPNDAIRYMNAIRPVLQKIGLEEGAIWRRK